MGSLKRKMMRNRMKRVKKDVEKQMKRQLMMFDKLEDECAACQEPFDKKSKEHAKTWKVVVREDEEVVRLYCPQCWGKANKIIKELENDLRISQETGREMPDESQP
jgi:Zn finger protein HypA/HybF involved in hydrogenase expression